MYLQILHTILNCAIQIRVYIFFSLFQSIQVFKKYKKKHKKIINNPNITQL